MVLTEWDNFCEEYHIERFVHKAIDAAFDDPKLREETVLFAHDIGEAARQAELTAS